MDDKNMIDLFTITAIMVAGLASALIATVVTVGIDRAVKAVRRVTR